MSVCDHSLPCECVAVDDVELIRYKRSRSYEAIVTWRYLYSDFVHVTDHEVEWQPEERDVGVSAGPIVYGDGPARVIEAAGEALWDKLADDWT